MLPTAFCSPFASTPSLLSSSTSISSTCNRYQQKTQRFSSSFAPLETVITKSLNQNSNSNKNNHGLNKVLIKCNMPGNIEDIPLEKIPTNVEEIPAYWYRPGVYGIYSSKGELQFVAASDNIANHVRAHLENVPNSNEVVSSIRMLTSDTVDEDTLNIFAERWVMSLYETSNDLPPGNTDAIPEFRIDPFQKDVYFSNDIVASDSESRIDMEIKNILRNHKVVLFIKGTRDFPKCGFSKSVVDILQKQELDKNFVCVDCLDGNKNSGLRDGIKKYSNWPTIPQLYVNGDFVGGADIVQEMEYNGELPVLLNS